MLNKSSTSQSQIRVGHKHKLSLIIPTTGDGKAILEHTLFTVYEHCKDIDLEIIIIDNASIDDTHDYLNQLEEEAFLNAKIVRNKENKGFARSINQGLEIASGEFLGIMHNDIILHDDVFSTLIEALEENKEIGIAAPSATSCFNEDQISENISDNDSVELRFADSFLFVLRSGLKVFMDEDYELAYFEDQDLSMQVISNGFKIIMLPQLVVEHRYASTCRILALDPESDVFWKNAAYFDSKWRHESLVKPEWLAMPVASQLIQIEQIINPRYPEHDLIDYIKRILTKEAITQLFSMDLSPELLAVITRLMMIIDDRPLLRRFEDKLVKHSVPIYLARELAEYYFGKNIYSRADLYVQSVNEEYRTLPFRIIEAQLLVEKRELEEAVHLLQGLMRNCPYHPELLKLSGDIHKFTGNKEEAKSFYRLAEEVHPNRYSSDELLF